MSRTVPGVIKASDPPILRPQPPKWCFPWRDSEPEFNQPPRRVQGNLSFWKELFPGVKLWKVSNQLWLWNREAERKSASLCLTEQHGTWTLPEGANPHPWPCVSPFKMTVCPPEPSQAARSLASALQEDLQTAALKVSPGSSSQSPWGALHHKGSIISFTRKAVFVWDPRELMRW